MFPFPWREFKYFLNTSQKTTYVSGISTVDDFGASQGKLKSVWDTAGTYCGRYSPQQTGSGYYWKKYIYLPTPPYPQPQLKKVPESTRLAGRELN